MVALTVAACAALAAVAFVATMPLGRPGSVLVGSSPLLGKPAPQIDLRGLEGEPVRLSDYRGRPVIVNFWASWCVPCVDEFPLLAAARSDHARDGLEILGVVHDDAADSARAFTSDFGAAWPMPFDGEDVAWNDYGAAGTPMTYFVDPDGVVRAVSFGPLTEAGLAQQLATILPAAEAPPGTSPE